MTQQEKLEQVGHWFSATLHRAVDSFKFSVLSFEF
jgi:hypothetical protein